MIGLTKHIDDRLLVLHQRIADAVYFRTGLGCYALGATCYAVVTMLVVISYAFWLWVGPQAGGSTSAILETLPAWVIFLSVAVAVLLCSVHVRRLWQAQLRADVSWENGGLPELPSPAFVRLGSRLLFAYIGVSKGLLLCFLGLIAGMF